MIADNDFNFVYDDDTDECDVSRWQMLNHGYGMTQCGLFYGKEWHEHYGWWTVRIRVKEYTFKIQHTGSMTHHFGDSPPSAFIRATMRRIGRQVSMRKKTIDLVKQIKQDRADAAKPT